MIYRYRSLLKRIKRLAHGSDCELYLYEQKFFVFSDLRALDDFSPLNPHHRIPDSIPRVDFSDFPEEFSAVEYLVSGGFLKLCVPDTSIYRLTASGLHHGEMMANRFLYEFVRSFLFPCLVSLATFVAANTWPPLQSALSQLIQALRP